MDVCVVAVDVGSVRPPSRFAWVALDTRGAEPIGAGIDPATAVDAVAAALTRGDQVALLLEAPMAVPVPDRWEDLGKARAGEGNRPWSAGAGAGVLATGIAQATWIFKALAERVPACTATTQPATWQSGQAQLLLAEAFVSGTGKPVPVGVSSHAADAAAAGRDFLDRLHRGPLVSDVVCGPHAAVNLLAATAIGGRLPIAEHELRADVLVLKVRPVRSGGGVFEEFARGGEGG
ncbi:hypothetical protein GCM10010435_71090 [Winogradskya consettensis]|uniref:DUF429 domain-containing protein n=1 Tax=Winogradskya consettensis TaxID=113560 RepID=A0A919SHV2_9ACTN|nr:hypothetical protein [Actinoplanes consettensis]GIM71303.1 hypothetical protein Aco04nite_24600 [Actinoplanes consettensis]